MLTSTHSAFTIWLYCILLHIILKCCASQTIITTCGGNGGNATCVFPFIFGGVSWNQCTYYGKTQRWCSTTSNYDVNQTWGYCDCPYNDQPYTPSPTNTETGDHFHYMYSKASLNNGVLKTLIIPVIFEDDPFNRSYINMTKDDYENTINSIATFYLDSSFGKLSYSFHWAGPYITSLPSATTNGGGALLDGYKFAEQDGYIWCEGICGSPNKIFVDDNHFDQILSVAHHLDSFGGWSGLGIVGWPKSWLIN